MGRTRERTELCRPGVDPSDHPSRVVRPNGARTAAGFVAMTMAWYMATSWFVA